MDSQLFTDFASPERSSHDVLEREIEHFKKMHNLAYFLDVVPNIVTVLNENRQIVFANKTFTDALNLSSPDLLYGKRPGEALGCINAYKNQAGCGTSRFCRHCQAVHSIISALDGSVSTAECTILRKGTAGSLELRVHSHPFCVDKSKYVVFSAVDISHENRRKFLERSFFHDISNALTGVRGYAEILQTQNLGKANEWVKKMMFCVNEAVDELFSQKSLLAAEDGELKVEPSAVNSINMIESIKNIFDAKSILMNPKLIIDENSESHDFVSDRTLLSRVLINTVKNAIEASGTEPVKVGCRKHDDKISFHVSNPQHIPEEIQSQIFKKSFSTKGKNRGLGTYSMKLLTEKYLKGTVSFTSDRAEGTTFFIRLPCEI